MLSIATHNQTGLGALVGARSVICPMHDKPMVNASGTTYRHFWTEKHAVTNHHSQRAGTT